jgi:hypothetical protein
LSWSGKGKWHQRHYLPSLSDLLWSYSGASGLANQKFAKLKDSHTVLSAKYRIFLPAQGKIHFQTKYATILRKKMPACFAQAGICNLPSLPLGLAAVLSIGKFALNAYIHLARLQTGWVGVRCGKGRVEIVIFIANLPQFCWLYR